MAEKTPEHLTPEKIEQGRNPMNQTPAERAREIEPPDPLLAEAKAVIAETGKPSVSRLQRHFGIGFVRASRLLEQIERDSTPTP